MLQVTCPWCDVELPLSFADATVEQTCPECRTAWRFEDETDQRTAELALAA